MKTILFSLILPVGFPVAGVLTTESAAHPVPEDPIVPEVREHFNPTLREFIELIRPNNAKPLYVIMGGLRETGRKRLLPRYSPADAHGSAPGAERFAKFIGEQALKAMAKPN